MTSPPDMWIRAEDPSAIGAIRRTAVTLAEAAGFSAERAGQLAVAVSEAVSNLVKHAVDGQVLLRSDGRVVEFVATDRGPGMADIERALRDGYSTAGTLGIGMGAIARMAGWYDVYSVPTLGTVLAMTFANDGADAPVRRAAGVRRPIGEEVACGDAFTIADSGEVTTVMLCDGLGHGEAAAHASQEAVRIFHEAPEHDPVAILGRLHRGLGHTRGGAVAVARVERDRIVFAGLGNISGWVAYAGGRTGMISAPGIAGHHGRTLRAYEYELPPYATVVLHSDGVSERWDPATLPGLFVHSPLVVSATLLSRASRRDDACVVAVRPGYGR